METSEGQSLHGQVSDLPTLKKRFFLFIGNLAACISQRTFRHWLKSSCSAKLLAGRANCSGQIISLRHLTRV